MKKSVVVLMAVLFLVAMLGGCTAAADSSGAASSGEVQSVAQSMPEDDAAAIQVAGLNGPTTMGMVGMMANAEQGEGNYQVTTYGTPDEIVPLLVSGEVAIAAIPANLASVLYNSTEGKVSVAAVNTLGVLYVMDTDGSIQSIEDLRGRTVYSTGKGTTPEYVLNYILEQNGINPQTDLVIEYKSEAAEIAALLGSEQAAVAVLPQPFVASVQAQNENARTALSLTAEWDAVAENSMVTGVLVVNNEWLSQNGEAFETFLADYNSSIEWVNANVAEAAELVVQYGIVGSAAIAEAAIPNCNIVYMEGEEMRGAVEGYLEVLHGQNPEAVGGAMPDDAFYYMGA